VANGKLTAGLYARLFIYSGLESKQVHVFGPEEFVSGVQVRVGPPSGVTALTGVSVAAYEDDALSIEIFDGNTPINVPTADAEGFWTLGIPVSYIGQPVYFKAKDGNGDVYVATVDELKEAGDFDAELVKQNVIALGGLANVAVEPYREAPNVEGVEGFVIITDNVGNQFIKSGKLDITAAETEGGPQNVTITLVAKEDYVFTIAQADEATWIADVLNSALGANTLKGIDDEDDEAVSINFENEKILIVTAVYTPIVPTVGVEVKVDFPEDVVLTINTDEDEAEWVSADGTKKTITAEWNKTVTLTAEVDITNLPADATISGYRWALDDVTIVDTGTVTTDNEIEFSTTNRVPKTYRLTVFVTIGGVEYSSEDVTFKVQ
jgi:hypothetical protein